MLTVNRISRFIHYIFISTILISCSSEDSVNNGSLEQFIDIELSDENVVLEPHESKSVKCALKENIEILGEIISFDIINSDRFVISTSYPSCVFIYDMSGNQLKIINSVGRGTNEFISPTITKCFNDKIYVWCNRQLKLIIYNSDGEAIKEYVNFERAIRDFVIYEDYVVFYQTKAMVGSYITIYDLAEESFINDYGISSEEHILLNTRPDAGGIEVYDNNLLYSSIDKLSVNSVNFNTLKEIELLSFTDSEFKISELKGNARNIINKNKAEVINYLNINSYIKGLYKLNNNLVILAEVGKYIMDGSRLNYSNRYNKLYYINLLKKEIKGYKYNLNFPTNNLFASYRNKLFYIELETDGENFQYYLINLMVGEDY